MPKYGQFLLFIPLCVTGVMKGEELCCLVNVSSIRRPPLEEIRYATRANFTAEQLYPFPAAYVRKELIPRLEAVQLPALASTTENAGPDS
jgi:D-alanyl-D-alanine dipeptidase